MARNEASGQEEDDQSVGAESCVCQFFCLYCSALPLPSSRGPIRRHRATRFPVHCSASATTVKWRQGWCGQFASLWLIRKRKIMQLRVSELRSRHHAHHGPCRERGSLSPLMGRHRGHVVRAHTAVETMPYVEGALPAVSSPFFFPKK